MHNQTKIIPVPEEYCFEKLQFLFALYCLYFFFFQIIIVQQPQNLKQHENPEQ